MIPSSLILSFSSCLLSYVYKKHKHEKDSPAIDWKLIVQYLNVYYTGMALINIWKDNAKNNKGLETTADWLANQIKDDTKNNTQITKADNVGWLCNIWNMCARIGTDGSESGNELQLWLEAPVLNLLHILNSFRLTNTS